VLVAEEQGIMRAGLRALLETSPEIAVVAEAASGRDACRLAADLQPDVVILDIQLPDVDGIGATRLIRQASGGRTHVLVLTTLDHDEIVRDAVRAGATGFLLKSALPDDVVRAVHTVAAGGGVMSPVLMRRIFDDLARRPVPATPHDTALSALTGREIEVLRLVGHGLDNAAIAERLTIGETTVKSHVHSLFRKLGVTDRANAVVKAFTTGLVTPGEQL
jgi:DNA-binding NarL/FixJ family response regulator